MIDLVILDMTMPVMNGEEAFREMKTIGREVRAILASGNTEQAAMERFAGKGLAGFLQKPYRMRDLIDTVRDRCPDIADAGEQGPYHPVLMKLGPVLQKLDFFSSEASVTVRDGPLAVRTKRVTTYKSPVGNKSQTADAN